LKILILKPSSLGDVVQAIPILRMLKAHERGSSIYWWVSSELAGVLQHDPDLTGLFLFQRQRWSAPWHWHEAVRSITQIRAQRFDLVVDLQGLARSALFAWLAGAARTLGVEDWREGAPAFYDVAVPRPRQRPHAVDWYLAVLGPLGVPVRWDFEWLPVHADAAQRIAEKWRPGDSKWIVLSPGASWLNKRWPAESYAQLARELARSYRDFRFVILGTRADAGVGRAIVEGGGSQFVDLTGQTSIPEMIEWIRLSQLLVTNDSGPMHVAAALKKPVAALFGPTDPRRTGPYGQPEGVVRIPLPCAPCLKPRCRFERPMECLRALSPELVRAKCMELLPLE
jgi:lipopolysaccharide heptosyltransferase II